MASSRRFRSAFKGLKMNIAPYADWDAIVCVVLWVIGSIAYGFLLERLEKAQK
jgi:hypothetical protein